MSQQSAIQIRTVLANQLETLGMLNLDAEWVQLQGGRTNRIWRVISAHSDTVVKLYANGRDNPLFPNDPASEIRILRYLEDKQIAPRLLGHAQTSLGDCLIYTHLKGHVWSENTPGVARLLKRVHQLSAPTGLRKVADGSAALKQQTLNILCFCPDAAARSVLRLEPKNTVAPSGRFCLLHGDPVAGNIIGTSDTLSLIDWQCPALGDPCEDLALFLSPAMQLVYRGQVLTDAEKSSFLTAYDDHETATRYKQLAPWYHLRMIAYCLWKEGRDDPYARPAMDAEIEALKTAICEQITID